jgi:hypothetical protein
MIVATMSTIPPRRETFLALVKRMLYEQTMPLDALHVCLHDYGGIDPTLPQDPRLHYVIGKANEGPWVRYKIAEKLAGADIIATLDDDTHYPHNYIERGVADLVKTGKNSVVCYGGLRWSPFVDSVDYYAPDRILIFPYSGLRNTFRVALLQGICSFMRAGDVKGAIQLPLPGFNTNDDLMISYHLFRTGRKIYCCPKERGWIQQTPNSAASHALFVRDKSVRQETFCRMVKELGFDPTAGWLDELRQFRRHIVVLVSEVPVLSADPTLHERIVSACTEDTVVHVLAPVMISKLLEAGPFGDSPYLLHPIPVHENEGRLGKLSLVRKWRGRRLEALAQATWHKRLNALLTNLPNVEVVDWRKDE